MICKKHSVEFDPMKGEGCPECIAQRVKVQSEIDRIGKNMVEAYQAEQGQTSEDFSRFAEAVNKGATIAGAPLYGPETAVALRPGEDAEVHGYHQDATKLLEYAEKRVITSLEDNKAANDDLTEISKLKKAMVAKKMTYLDPLKIQIDAIRDTYNYLMTPVLEADKLTRRKMLEYSAEQDRRRREQEEINRKRIEAAHQEMELNGELTESVNLVDVQPEAPKRVITDMGSSGKRDNWKYEVVDFALLPDSYKVPDNAQLNAIAKSHHDKKQVPGVRFYNDPIIAVRPR